MLKVQRVGTGDFERQYDKNACGRQSSYFVWLNHGKELLALDLKTKENQALLKSGERVRAELGARRCGAYGPGLGAACAGESEPDHAGHQRVRGEEGPR